MFRLQTAVSRLCQAALAASWRDADLLSASSRQTAALLVRILCPAELHADIRREACRQSNADVDRLVVLHLYLGMTQFFLIPLGENCCNTWATAWAQKAVRFKKKPSLRVSDTCVNEWRDRFEIMKTKTREDTLYTH